MGWVEKEKERPPRAIALLPRPSSAFLQVSFSCFSPYQHTLCTQCTPSYITFPFPLPCPLLAYLGPGAARRSSHRQSAGSRACPRPPTRLPECRTYYCYFSGLCCPRRRGGGGGGAGKKEGSVQQTRRRLLRHAAHDGAPVFVRVWRGTGRRN